MPAKDYTLKDSGHQPFYLIDGMGVNWFFLILFLFQILFVFQGIDIADEGFHSTFYQQIFNNPQSVEYNFMYWLSGIVGGAWLKLFPEYGLLGLRIGGVILNMLAVIISYNLLKNYIHRVYLKLGLLLIVLINGAAVKDINYNNISALFFVAAIFFLFRALKENKLSGLFLSGALVSLATFSRLANISGLALLLVIVYSGFFVFIRTIVYQAKQVFLFISGFIGTAILVFGIMKMTGHFDLFMGSVQLVKGMAASSENTHDITKLIRIFLGDYTTAVFKRALPLCLIVLLYYVMLNYLKGNPVLVRILTYISSAVFLLLLLGVVVIDGTLTIWTYLIMLFAAMSLIAGLSIIFNKNKTELALISLAGMIMSFSLIAGADYGISASGSTALWIGMPIATDFFLEISAINLNGSYETRDQGAQTIQNKGLSLSVTNLQLRHIWNWGVYTSIVVLILHSILYTYNDNPNRMKMTYAVHNGFLTGVFTTRERADAINGLLEASSKYIHQNDYVITYRDIPMYYSFTQTRPFIKNSWPSLYTRSQIESELNKAVMENHILPPIVYQKVKTIPGPFWPNPNPADSAFDLNKPKNEPIRKFIEKYNYKIIWENMAFKIYMSDSNPSPSKTTVQIQ